MEFERELKLAKQECSFNACLGCMKKFNCNDWFLPTYPLWPLQVFGHSLKSWEGDTMGGNISSIPGANGRSSSKLWTLSVSLMPPGDEQASRPSGFSLLLFSRSLKEGREARPQHYAFFFFFFFFLNRTCGGWKFTLQASKLETIIFVHMIQQ